MTTFTSPEFSAHEHVSFLHDRSTGLRAIIAIHRVGPKGCGGGIRMWPYPREEDAVADALRLSRAMSYKFAMAGIPIGGGKSVIIGDPATDKTDALMESFGRAVERINTLYICGPDVGTASEDMVAVRRGTPNVRGLPDETGDTSPATGFGIYRAMKAAAKQAFGSDDLGGRSVAVQGTGHVGQALLRHLRDEGARLFIADVDPGAVGAAAERFGAEVVPPDEILFRTVDIVAPCALGGVVNDESLPRLDCRVICGGANNQLAEPRHGAALHERGILFVPDYIANAGGAIHATQAGDLLSPEDALEHVAAIYDTCLRVFARSESDGIPVADAADRLAEEVMESW
ncbi:MAG: amino acid dehydrogenase [Gemmatimonadetes bacterium]|nr:amino acid dehydrogenase [Gemmatimonadota bacterium]